MRVASGTGLCNEGPLAGLCRDGLTAEFWKIRPPVGPPSGQQYGCGSGAVRSPARGMNVRTATAASTTTASH